MCIFFMIETLSTDEFALKELHSLAQLLGLRTIVTLTVHVLTLSTFVEE